MSQELTPEQMRVMIAEACGYQLSKWKLVNEPCGKCWTCEKCGESYLAHVEDLPVICRKPDMIIPDYCADLNAMAQAAQYAGENLFDADDWEKFGRELEAQHPTASLKDAQGKFYEDTYYQLASLVTGLSALNIATAFCRVLQTRKGE